MSQDLSPRLLERVLAERERRERTEAYFNDPVGWAEYMLGVRLWSKQREIARDVADPKKRNIAVKAGHGVGKLLAKETPIISKEGWVLAKDIKVGDQIFDEMGQLTTVTGLSPVWVQDKYRITFDDGAVIEAGEQHEWNVLDLRKRKRYARGGVDDWRTCWDFTETLTSKDLYQAGVKTDGGQGRWRIPLASPLQLPEADLPIDPYLLGVWLGDGNSSAGNFTIGDAKLGILEHLDALDYEYNVLHEPEHNRHIVKLKSFMPQLRELGVLNNKHIPMQYLRASEEQRRALLAGLMDTDGFLLKATGGADVGIDLTRKQLADDLYDLLMTLGCKVRRSEGEAAYTLDGERHVTGTRYRMNWTPLENPFRVRGQEWREPKAQRSRHTVRTIVDIQIVGTCENFCIEVDSPRHLYLGGRDLIPTHNSFLAAVLACWWVDTRYPNAVVASTAPNNHQINAIVWREIRRMYQTIEQRYKDGVVDHKLPGTITGGTKESVWQDGGIIIGFGRKPPDGKEEDRFQGIHDGYVLALGDEACGLSESMIDALGNITSNEGSTRLLIANPTNPGSYFAKLFREKDKARAWVHHTISVFDSPKMTSEKYEMSEDALTKLSGQEYIDDKKLEYGEGSARYKARVLGEFAYETTDSLITPEDLAIADDCEVIVDPAQPPVLGVDIAEKGEDKSVVYMTQFGFNEAGESAQKIRLLDSWSGADAIESAKRVHDLAQGVGAREVRIDGANFGAAVATIIETYDSRTYPVIRLYGQSVSPDKFQWFNSRAFWYDDLRSRIRKNLIDLDPEDERLHDELMMMEYKFQSGGGLLMESKLEMRKRGLKSPDFADSVVYASASTEHLFGEGIESMPVGSEAILDIEDLPGYLTAFPW